MPAPLYRGNPHHLPPAHHHSLTPFSPADTPPFSLADPWAKREAWRKVRITFTLAYPPLFSLTFLLTQSPIFSNTAMQARVLSLSPPSLADPLSPPLFFSRFRFRNLFPGFGIAVVAFSAYVAYDNTIGAAAKAAHHGDAAAHH